MTKARSDGINRPGIMQQTPPQQNSGPGGSSRHKKLADSVFSLDSGTAEALYTV